MPLVTSRTVPCLLFVIISFFFTLSLSYSCTFTVTNNCPYTIWPGTLAGSGTPQLPTTGFQLDSGQTLRIPSVPGWSGRLWARTGCTFDKSGAGKCQTGDCGGRLECDGNGASPPASLFEITLGKGTDKDFYDVSLVDGYNLPLIAVPRGVHGACNATGCASDVNTGKVFCTLMDTSFCRCLLFSKLMTQRVSIYLLNLMCNRLSERASSCGWRGWRRRWCGCLQECV